MVSAKDGGSMAAGESRMLLLGIAQPPTSTLFAYILQKLGAGASTRNGLKSLARGFICVEAMKPLAHRICDWRRNHDD
jgi:hypothetical protein